MGLLFAAAVYHPFFLELVPKPTMSNVHNNIWMTIWHLNSRRVESQWRPYSIMSQTFLNADNRFWRYTTCFIGRRKQHASTMVWRWWQEGDSDASQPCRARRAQSTCCSASGAHEYVSSSDSSRHFLHFTLHYDASQVLPFRVISGSPQIEVTQSKCQDQLYGISELHVILHANGILCWILRRWAHHFALKIINKRVKVVLVYFCLFVCMFVCFFF